MSNPTGGGGLGPAVRLAELRVARGGRDVLRGISVEIPRGIVTGLLGPSGCGKSTLIRAVAGIQANVRGTCEVLDRPAGSPKLRRRIGYVSQQAAVYQDLTVRENLAYFAKVIAATKSDVARVLDEVDLVAEADEQVRSLSGGQLNRVSLAAALLGRPELLLLDEPTVGLDPVLRRDLWDLFHRLASGGAALLVSSHVIDEATRCDRLLLMRDGVLLADDTPSGLIARTGSQTVEDAFLALVEATDRPGART